MWRQYNQLKYTCHSKLLWIAEIEKYEKACHVFVSNNLQLKY